MQDTHQFSGIDAAKWTRIKDQVKAKVGVTISGDVGEASSKGIEISWSYNATTLNLTITVVKTSWYDPSISVIDTNIEQLVASA
jgi:hypothetical protein